jgi:hypothetical protein
MPEQSMFSDGQQDQHKLSKTNKPESIGATASRLDQLFDGVQEEELGQKPLDASEFELSQTATPTEESESSESLDDHEKIEEVGTGDIIASEDMDKN